MPNLITCFIVSLICVSLFTLLLTRNPKIKQKLDQDNDDSKEDIIQKLDQDQNYSKEEIYVPKTLTYSDWNNFQCNTIPFNSTPKFQFQSELINTPYLGLEFTSLKPSKTIYFGFSSICE
jgi:hypothetical protein